MLNAVVLDSSDADESDTTEAQEEKRKYSKKKGVKPTVTRNY